MMTEWMDRYSSTVLMKTTKMTIMYIPFTKRRSPTNEIYVDIVGVLFYHIF